MNERVKRKTKINKVRTLILAIIALFSISSLYLVYNIWLLSGIEDVIRFGAMGFIGVLIFVFLIIGLRSAKRKKFKPIIIFIALSLLIGSLEFVGALYINKAYTSISKMNKTDATYSTSLITMSDSKIKSVADLKNKKIGIIKDTKSVEGYVISQDIIKDNNIDKKSLTQYDDFLSMLNDLYDKKIDAIFISGEYVSMFSSIDQFGNIKDETKVIITKKKTMPKQENTASNNTSAKITKPFTMLIMGIDSTEENIKSTTSFNGDSLILVTFNPKTLNATMLSIPRDTFVPIMCFKNHIQNKITHAAWYGESCMISTIENFTGIDIDYYAKINFKGVVKLVDSLGGVDVDVPYNFCEQNSNREWGKNTVYVEKGYQTLNGEQALAFARNRHPNPTMCNKKWTNYYSDDFIRGQNQQTVVKALINKIKNVRDINKVYEILDLMEKSMDTNLSTSQILSFYDIGKNILTHMQTNGDILDFEKLYLKTYGAYIYDEGMRLELSDQIYFKGSLNDVVDAMKVNLGLKEPTIIKTFSFSVNKTYEEKVIGKDTYNEAGISLVPNFTSYSKVTATSWGTKNGVSITFKTVDSNESKYHDGQIINQSVPKNSLVSIAKTKGITLTIVNKVETETPPVTSNRIDCTEKDNENNSACVVPDFLGKSKTDVQSWASKLTSSSVTVISSLTTCKTNDDKKTNIVCSQSGPAAGESLYDASEHTITIKYYEYEEAEEPDSLNPVLPSGN